MPTLVACQHTALHTVSLPAAIAVLLSKLYPAHRLIQSFREVSTLINDTLTVRVEEIVRAEFTEEGVASAVEGIV